MQQSTMAEVPSQSNQERDRVVVLGTYVVGNSAYVPEYCAFTVNAKFLQRISSLVELCIQHELSQVRMSATPDHWGDTDTENGACLEGGELVVSATGEFWFTDSSEHGYTFHSEETSVEQVTDLITKSPEQIVFFDRDLAESFESDHCPDDNE